MKKLTTLCLASLSLLTLMACSKQETTHSPSQTVTSASSTKSSQTSSSSSTEKKSSSSSSEETKTSSSQETDKQKTVTETSSDQATEEKKETETETESQTQMEEHAQPLPTNEDLYASTLYLVASDPTLDPNLHYAFWDIDGNGTAELVTARIYGGVVYPEAIYYQQNGVSTYLARSYVAGGGGRRESFTIYTDGTIEWDEWSSGSGGGTAYLYQLAGDNSGHWLIGQQDFNQRELPNPNYVNQFGDGRAELNLASLWWNAF